MPFQQSPATKTITRDGQPVKWIVNYDAKSVSVYIGGVCRGTFICHTAAKQALDLIDVPAKYQRRQRVKEQW